MRNNNPVVSCDLCGDRIDNRKAVNYGPSEEHPISILTMRYDIWYGGTFKVEDTCKPCNNKLAKFLQDKNMLKGQKV